jgi:hypothetical protein
MTGFHGRVEWLLKNGDKLQFRQEQNSIGLPTISEVRGVSADRFNERGPVSLPSLAEPISRALYLKQISQNALAESMEALANITPTMQKAGYEAVRKPWEEKAEGLQIMGEKTLADFTMLYNQIEHTAVKSIAQGHEPKQFAGYEAGHEEKPAPTRFDPNKITKALQDIQRT